MRYTTLGNTGLHVSVLGFGCMRLPVKDGRIDRNLSTPLLRRAVNLGINLFDTAPGYGPVAGESESAVGEALEGLRDQVLISTKNPLRNVNADAWLAQLRQSLARLRTDHIDLYHLHGINWKDYERHFDPERGGLVLAMRKAKADGLIRHAAFSFHDEPAALVRIAESGVFENVIVQYNLLDQSNSESIAKVNAMGLGVVVMGPVGGGRLGISSERMREVVGIESAVEAAFRFVWAHPGVHVALSGMQDLAMLEANAALAANAAPFTAEQVMGLNALVRERKERSGLYCSGCRYCVPVCQPGIDIPGQLEYLNQHLVFGIHQGERYGSFKASALQCLDCGRCSAACPQGIDIPGRLRDMAERWDPRFGAVQATATMQDVSADGAFRLTLDCVNFSRQSLPMHSEVAADGDTSVTPLTTGTYDVAPFKHHRVAVTGRCKPDSGHITLHAGVQARDQRQELVVDYRFLLLPPGWSPWQEFHATAADFTQAAETAALHAVRFRLGRDEQALLLEADVQDDFLYPSRQDRDQGKWEADVVELYLDCRPLDRCRDPAYGPGVYQIFLYPGTPGTHPAFASSKLSVAPTVEATRTSNGYRLTARLPFANLVDGGSVPRRIGFDLAVNTADRDGRCLGQYRYAGSKDNWRDTAPWRDVWLV